MVLVAGFMLAVCVACTLSVMLMVVMEFARWGLVDG